MMHQKTPNVVATSEYSKFCVKHEQVKRHLSKTLPCAKKCLNSQYSQLVASLTNTFYQIQNKIEQIRVKNCQILEQNLYTSHFTALQQQTISLSKLNDEMMVARKRCEHTRYKSNSNDNDDDDYKIHYDYNDKGTTDTAPEFGENLVLIKDLSDKCDKLLKSWKINATSTTHNNQDTSLFTFNFSNFDNFLAKLSAIAMTTTTATPTASNASKNINSDSYSNSNVLESLFLYDISKNSDNNGNNYNNGNSNHSLKIFKSLQKQVEQLEMEKSDLINQQLTLQQKNKSLNKNLEIARLCIQQQYTPITHQSGQFDSHNHNSCNDTSDNNNNTFDCKGKCRRMVKNTMSTRFTICKCSGYCRECAFNYILNEINNGHVEIKCPVCKKEDIVSNDIDFVDKQNRLSNAYANLLQKRFSVDNDNNYNNNDNDNRSREGSNYGGGRGNNNNDYDSSSTIIFCDNERCKFEGEKNKWNGNKNGRYLVCPECHSSYCKLCYLSMRYHKGQVNCTTAKNRCHNTRRFMQCPRCSQWQENKSANENEYKLIQFCDSCKASFCFGCEKHWSPGKMLRPLLLAHKLCIVRDRLKMKQSGIVQDQNGATVRDSVKTATTKGQDEQDSGFQLVG